VKIGLLQLNATVGALRENAERLVKAYRDAVALGADLVVAPELFLCGYPPRDLLLRPEFILKTRQAVAECAAAVGDVPLAVGYVDVNPTRPGKPLWNQASILWRGGLVQTIRKQLLPTYDVFDEARYFEPGGDSELFMFGGRRIGVTICEDIWNDEDFWPERIYRRDPVLDLVAKGADLIVNLSASPWVRGKERLRVEMLRRVARDEKTPIVQANMVGGNDELIFDGHSVALDASGQVLHLSPGFAENVSVVDLDGPAKSEPCFLDEMEALRDALCLGIGDYVRKCGFKSALIGLSGGIDSALTAVLAARALGPENVRGVAMPSRFSSRHSLDDAAALAARLGIQHDVISIETPFQSMEAQMEPLFKGLRRNEAEENIQSRLRGVTLMALSNKFGSLVLTTGNKSEMAVGYCTLYGDMCGALAPLADLWKTEVYALSRWINRDGEIIPTNTIEKPPSAELRPDQTDQDSLPPYDILDQILELSMVRQHSRAEIIASGFAQQTVDEVLNKVTFSEYKRRQSAPGLKISPIAFGVGRRIPIAQRFRA